MKSESPEHVSMDVTDFGSVEKEEASSSPQKRKEKEESNENFEPNYKKAKLEEDDFFAAYSTSSSSKSDGDERSSAMELDDEDKEYHELMKKHLHYKFQLREFFSEAPLIQIQPENIENINTIEDIESYAQGIVANFPELIGNPLPEPHVLSVVVGQVLLEISLKIEHEIFEAVKRLYEHIPYVMRRDSEEQIRKKIDLNDKLFSYVSKDSIFHKVVEIFEYLLRRKERLFHPLIRKSYCKSEFFKLVDEDRKLAIRDLLKEYYEYCCKQIELQEEFDMHLFNQKTKLLQSVGCIRELINDVDVVPEKFKQLNNELVELSLKASIKAHQWHEMDTKCYATNFKLLVEKHNNRETRELDDKLNKFCKNYPRIFDFSLDEQFDSATEERFKEIIDEMKKNWFVGIADHFLIEATLLYMQSIKLEDGGRKPSWLYVFEGRPISLVFGTRFAHEHPIYDHVFSVDYKLVCAYFFIIFPPLSPAPSQLN
ncbi:uncharacterized protein LOC144575934 [Carex rostrata]